MNCHASKITLTLPVVLFRSGFIDKLIQTDSTIRGPDLDLFPQLLVFLSLYRRKSKSGNNWDEDFTKISFESNNLYFRSVGLGPL